MKKIVRDMILNVVFIVFGVAIALLIPSQVPETATNLAMGPNFFPMFAAGLMILVNGLSLALNYMHYTKDKAKGVKEELVEKTNTNDQKRVLLVLAIIAVYIFFMPIVGYVISTLVVVNALLFILKVRKWYHYVLVSAFALVIYFVFTQVLYVMLP